MKKKNNKKTLVTDHNIGLIINICEKLGPERQVHKNRGLTVHPRSKEGQRNQVGLSHAPKTYSLM